MEIYLTLSSIFASLDKSTCTRKSIRAVSNPPKIQAAPKNAHTQADDGIPRYWRAEGKIADKTAKKKYERLLAPLAFLYIECWLELSELLKTRRFVHRCFLSLSCLRPRPVWPSESICQPCWLSFILRLPHHSRSATGHDRFLLVDSRAWVSRSEMLIGVVLYRDGSMPHEYLRHGSWWDSQLHRARPVKGRG